MPSAPVTPSPRSAPPPSSPRRDDLLERAYDHVLAHGLAALSLRPLAAAVGSSPRVLLFLFGSKEDLVRALLARARADELALIEHVGSDGTIDLAELAAAIWRWLADPGRRGLLRLWVESYGRSLVEPDGPWAGFAAATVEDWLGLLAQAQPAAQRRRAAGRAQRTLALSILRGAMLDLLATGDRARVDAAVASGLRRLAAA